MNTAQVNTDPIIAIQVVPIIEPDDDDEEGVVNAQFEGPTEETTGWGIYYRHQSGEAVWAADADSEAEAMIVGRELAAQEKVEIEHQPWND